MKPRIGVLADYFVLLVALIAFGSSRSIAEVESLVYLPSLSGSSCFYCDW